MLAVRPDINGDAGKKGEMNMVLVSKKAIEKWPKQPFIRHKIAEGHFIRLGENYQIGDHFQVCDRVWLENNVVIGDDVTLGNGVHLGDNTHLENGVVLNDFVRLGKNVHLERDVYLGFHVRLGNGVHLGSQVRLESGVDIGDGVTSEGINEEFRSYYATQPEWIFWKWVNEDRTSPMVSNNQKIIYEKGKTIEEFSADISDQQCANGLHVFRPPYRPEWTGMLPSGHGLICLRVLVKSEDIMFAGLPTMDAKLRVRKLVVLD